MAHLGECTGIVAPYYNLALIIIAVILFIVLLRTKTKTDLKPWKLLFIAVLIYIVEQTAAALDKIGITVLPHWTFGFLEMGIIGIFIYTLLAQKECLKKACKPKK